MKDRFLRACWREPVDRTPVWFMRQAGRYLAGYKEIRAQHSVLEIAKTPDLSAKVTLLAVRELGVDAAILFADIMLPLEAMGVELDIVESVGPVIAGPLQGPDDVAKLQHFEPASVQFVAESVRMIKKKLGKLPLIGFCGAPFTLASYLIEGKPSKEFTKTKAFMWQQPAAWRDLMGQLAAAMSSYLRMQIEAGADAVQLFDSWVGCLDPKAYREHVLPFSKKIFDDLADLDVPKIHFGTNSATLLGAMREAGGDVISIDWRIPIDEAWERVGDDKALQGNLDPAVLLANDEAIEEHVKEILDRVENRPGHIFSLGHGVLPGTPVDHAKAVVEKVHAWTARGVASG